MQNNIQFSFLNNEEMLNIIGGNEGVPAKDSSFLDDVFHRVSIISICVYQFAKSAAEYQASLPPSLKK